MDGWMGLFRGVLIRSVELRGMYGTKAKFTRCRCKEGLEESSSLENRHFSHSFQLSISKVPFPEHLPYVHHPDPPSPLIRPKNPKLLLHAPKRLLARRPDRFPENELRLQRPVGRHVPFRLDAHVDQGVVVLQVAAEAFSLQRGPDYFIFVNWSFFPLGVGGRLREGGKGGSLRVYWCMPLVCSDPRRGI